MPTTLPEYEEALAQFLGEAFLKEHSEKIVVLYKGGFDVEICALTLFENYLVGEERQII